jgi:hypothetical protein
MKRRFRLRSKKRFQVRISGADVADAADWLVVEAYLMGWGLRWASMRPAGMWDVIDGRICFNGAVEVVKKALEGVGAAKTRLDWKAVRKQLLLATDGTAIVGAVLV